MADNDSRPAAQPTYESPVQNEPAPETKLDEPDVDVLEELAVPEIESAATVPVTAISTEPVPTLVSVVEPVEVAVPAAVDEVPDLMAGVLAWVGLGPVSADAPALPPVEAPALWGLLEFARRQEQQSLSNRAPAVAYDPKENVELADGTIVGDLRAIDPDGDALTYTVTQQPDHGTVVIHRDGTFTYTPDADAESARPELDTFTIDISDGVAKKVGPALSVKISLHRPPSVFDPSAGADDIDPSPDIKVFPQVVDTIEVSNPNEMAISPDGTRLYVTNNGFFTGNTVTVIDTETNSVVAIITVGDEPREVAVSPDGATAYVANLGGTVSVIDTTTNTVTATISVGVVPDGIAVSPDGGTVYVTQNDGTVSVIDTATHHLTTIAVGDNSHNLAVSPDGGTLYVTNTNDDTVSVINTATNSVTTIAVGDDPLGIAVRPDGARVYVVNANDDTVSVINTATNSVTTIAVGDFPVEVTVSADGAYAFVVNAGGGTVSVINTATNVVIGTIAVGDSPFGVVVSPDGDTLYVANNGDGTVSVIDLSAL
ncbi:beta-propeller fold lactonase family protein [Mycobacterium barrassiae]|uniref:beta-propeller fold lactonase family protein n=1 Tax=Mycobacterium barrassiae TaxID=319709 RepID=UPI002265CCB1|nr:beta-propeller fold lactonase family protein [Mycobacterium barrassiae]MCV7298439.1 beta-propeller fold lactonase family protein [Mycobacterium barrassiae]